MTVGLDATFLAPLTVREDMLLRLLARYLEPDWVRPYELGGYDRSWHKDVLYTLTQRGLVERQKARTSRRHLCRYEYRITRRGRTHIARNGRPTRRT